ncbi:helix-turn-helix transcriptional regulator [Bacillus luteolus]|uniref:Helix-turn-helix transcriptional regulator n=1 Tax=Litchfieldia luteola TaxID=682179 RepID=A0ABR9QMT8_9BACI|nr:helix-turn-helix transcriptional regulator [Cytobacillus luteolus]MBE4909479.1 helix-turn-helix transcriptional regulator [Cytobacillus luteolus]MBP1940880.1 transcriptional regulator with XRE-family HTH domain [Cytobacillus luteolus]
MDIGNRLRFYRIQQNMTQEDLASGIISISYLSKIENNQTSASVEVLEMLCKRLGIKLIEENEYSLLKDLHDWYYQIINRNKEEVARRYEKYVDVIQSTNDSSAYIHFVLFELRYFLLQRDLEKAEEQLNKINLFKDIFDDQMDYFYSKFVGLYHYMKNRFSTAKDFYKLAERILNKSIHIERWEEADLYYSIGLTYSQLGKMSLSNNYTHLALAIYQSRYDLKRSAECHVLLGICYLRTEEYELSEENYLLANKVAESMNDSNLRGIIYHNLGYLYSLQGKHHQAIAEYQKSLKHKLDGNIDGKLISIHGIITEYYSLGEYNSCESWLQEARKLQEENEYRDYNVHFEIYNYLINNPSEEFEKYMQDVALPLFEKRENLQYLIKYSEILGAYFETKFKYKSANRYYTKAIKALKKQNYIY